jgi:hypothetical protein
MVSVRFRGDAVMMPSAILVEAKAPRPEWRRSRKITSLAQEEL